MDENGTAGAVRVPVVATGADTCVAINDGRGEVDTVPLLSDSSKFDGEYDIPPETLRQKLARVFLGRYRAVPRVFRLQTPCTDPAVLRAHGGPFPPNIVRNQKYSVWSFLPLQLYEQFKYFYNLYFLATALTQFIPILKVGLCSAHTHTHMRAHMHFGLHVMTHVWGRDNRVSVYVHCAAGVCAGAVDGKGGV